MPSLGNIVVAHNAIKNMGLNKAVINFAKTKNDSAGQAAVKSYRKYWILSLLLWLAFSIILITGLFMIPKHYKKLNEPSNIKYSEVVTGRIHINAGTINYFKNEYVYFPVSEATWLLNNDLKDGDRINVFLDNEMKPVYMTKFYNEYEALFIFAPTMFVLLIVGIILINCIPAKKFADYRNWFVYIVLPLADNPNLETLVQNLEYRKLDFSTKDLNTKEAKALRKANKTQIICGVVFILLAILYPLIGMLCGEYFKNGIGGLSYIILIVIILPFAILGVNAGDKAKKIKGVVAEQNYNRIMNIEKNEK